MLVGIIARTCYCTNVSSNLRSIPQSLDNGTLHFPFVTYYFSYALCNSVNYHKYFRQYQTIAFIFTRINLPTHIINQSMTTTQENLTELLNGLLIVVLYIFLLGEHGALLYLHYNIYNRHMFKPGLLSYELVISSFL